MGYRILFDDLTVAQSVTTQSFNTCGETLGKLSEHVNFFANLPSLSGHAADRMKSYLAEVHGTLFASIGELLTEYQTRFILYKDDTFQLDSDLHAKLDEETFDSLLSYLPGSQGDFQTEAESLKSAVDTISDLVSNYGSSDISVNNKYGELIQSISDIREKVGTNEHTHVSNDLTAFKDLLTSFERLIASYMSQSKSIAIDYRSGSIAEIPAAQKLVVAFDKTQQGRAGLEAKLVEVGKREEQRYEALTAEAAQARVDQGIWQAIGATLAVVAGAAAIVLTAGMATPIVVTALVAGSASLAYGYSNLFEAGQNIGFGLAGDTTSAAFNPLRDTVFMGNQAAYDVFGFTATCVAGSMIPIGNAVNIAKAAGTSVTKAVIMGTGQSVLTVGAGYFGGRISSDIGYNISKDWFGADERTAQNISKASGMVGAVAAAAGTYKITGNIVNKVLQPKVNNTPPPTTEVNSVEGAKKIINKDGSVEIIGEGEIIETIDNRPYLNPKNRPSFRKGVPKKVFESAKKPDGKVYDPLKTDRVIEWEPGQPRKDVWDMGHKPGQKYSDMHKLYLDMEMTPAEFRDWYNNPNNYRPELPSTNRGHSIE